ALRHLRKARYVPYGRQREIRVPSERNTKMCLLTIIRPELRRRRGRSFASGAAARGDGLTGRDPALRSLVLLSGRRVGVSGPEVLEEDQGLRLAQVGDGHPGPGGVAGDEELVFGPLAEADERGGAHGQRAEAAVALHRDDAVGFGIGDGDGAAREDGELLGAEIGGAVRDPDFPV